MLHTLSTKGPSNITLYGRPLKRVQFEEGIYKILFG